MKENTENLPASYAGMTRIAAAIQAHFKISCQRQHIQNWKSRNPPFPAPRDSNRYDREECFAWVQSNIVAINNPVEQSEAEMLRQARIAKAQEQIKKAEKITLEVAVSKEKFIERATAEKTIRSAMIRYHSIVRAEIERNQTTDRREKLLMLGVDPAKVALFYEFDLATSRASIDRIEAHCAKAANGN